MRAEGRRSSGCARASGFFFSYEACVYLIVLAALFAMVNQRPAFKGDRLLLLQQTEDIAEIMARSPQVNQALREWMEHRSTGIKDALEDVAKEMNVCLTLSTETDEMDIGGGCEGRDALSLDRDYWYDGFRRLRIVSCRC